MRRSSGAGRRLSFLLALVLVAAIGTAAFAGGNGKRRPAPRHVYTGRVTWYGGRFHGRRTASGERFNRHANTLASRHLPFGTRVRVTNLRNGRSAIARVNDRGPASRRYIADLSEGLAARLGIKRAGVGRVRIEVLPPAPRKPARPRGRSLPSPRGASTK